MGTMQSKTAEGKSPAPPGPPGIDPQPALRRINEKWLLDLACENTRQLREAGIPKAHLVNLKICTVDENSHFYSSRKEKDAAGRMISFITKI